MKEKLISFFSFISDEIWDLFPENPLGYIYYLVFVFLLCLALIFYLAKKYKDENKIERNINTEKELSMDDLLKIAHNPKSTTKDLLSAFMLYNENFVIEQDKEKSFSFFEKVLNHNNRNKAVFDYFHGSILPKNIRYKDKLDEMEKKALNSLKK